MNHIQTSLTPYKSYPFHPTIYASLSNPTYNHPITSYPTTTPPQLHSQTIPSPSPITTVPPPQAVEPLPTPPPIHEDHAVQMDMEENLVSTPLPPQQIRPEDHFESQLRDIDSSIELLPPHYGDITKLLEKENATTTLKTPSARGQTPALQGPRSAFGDITNKTQLTTGDPKMQSAKKSWKKLARKQGNSTGIPLDPTHTKRSFYSLDDRLIMIST
jgi:hypothetical protein